MKINEIITRHRSNHENVRVLCELTEATRGLIVSATVLHGEEKVSVNQGYVPYETMSNLDIVRENTLLAAFQFAGTTVEANNDLSCAESDTSLPTNESQIPAIDLGTEDKSSESVPYAATPDPVPVETPVASPVVELAEDTLVDTDVGKKAAEASAETKANASSKPRRRRKATSVTDTPDIGEMQTEEKVAESAEDTIAETYEVTAVEEPPFETSAEEIPSMEEMDTATSEPSMVSREDIVGESDEEVKSEPEITPIEEPEVSSVEAEDAEAANEPVDGLKVPETVDEARAVVLTAKPGEKIAKKISASALKDYIGKPLGEFADKYPTMISILAARAGTAASVLSVETEIALKIIAGN